MSGDWTPTDVAEACEERDARYERGLALVAAVSDYLQSAGWTNGHDVLRDWVDASNPDAQQDGRSLGRAFTAQLARDGIWEASA